MFTTTLFFLIESLSEKCTVCHITKTEKAYDVSLMIYFNFFCSCRASNFLFMNVRFSSPTLKTRKNFEIFVLMIFIFIHFFDDISIILKMKFQISDVRFVTTENFCIVSEFSYTIISFENIVFKFSFFFSNESA